MEKFIFTSPFDILRGEAIEIEGEDRLFALTGMGFTVWTEEQWKVASLRAKEMNIDFPVVRKLHDHSNERRTGQVRVVSGATGGNGQGLGETSG